MDVLQAVSRSAAIILSKQLNKNLLYYFSSAEVILIVTCMHSLMSTVKSMQGFKASLHVMQELVQSLMIQALVVYIASGDYALVNMVLLVSVLECLPAIKGWVGADLASFEASVNYIFADKINHLGLPYIGVLGVAFRGEGLLSKTLVFTCITSLSDLAYEAVHGSDDLSIAWPIFLLYFVYEIMTSSRLKEQWESFFQFGLYRASDAIYKQMQESGNLLGVAVTFTLLSSLNPSDKVWTGITILVLVQCVSNYILETIIVLCRTDPFLAGMGVVTVVHFSSMALEAVAKLKASP